MLYFKMFKNIFKYLKVDERGRKCYVRFEDDSEYWILFKDLQKGMKNDQFNVIFNN